MIGTHSNSRYVSAAVIGHCIVIRFVACHARAAAQNSPDASGTCVPEGNAARCRSRRSSNSPRGTVWSRPEWSTSTLRRRSAAMQQLEQRVPVAARRPQRGVVRRRCRRDPRGRRHLSRGSCQRRGHAGSKPELRVPGLVGSFPDVTGLKHRWWLRRSRAPNRTSETSSCTQRCSPVTCSATILRSSVTMPTTPRSCSPSPDRNSTG